MAREIRGDIQGLRAVAVLTVIAAHVGVPFLEGGFVGVDIFYVISGYLISGLLYREIQAGGGLSLTTFWSRRARRILPAATLVTTLTLVVSLFYLSLIDARQVVLDALWATVFAANVNFAQQGTDYFTASEVGASPLQHYWSLAVEEQFYVVWPVLLLLCLGLGRVLVIRRRNQPRRTRQQPIPRRVIFTVLLLITAASFAWSLHQTATDPTVAYFSTFTRAWELGVGALAALVPARLSRSLGRRTVRLASVEGLAAVTIACLFYTNATAFPGYAAALPVLGTALLLVAGSGDVRSLVARGLSVKPLRTIGDWSFSLYLWHWPVKVLAERILGRALTPVELVAAVATTFALAFATYRYVEMPFRNGRPARALRLRRALVLYPVSLSLVAASAAGAWYWTGLQGEERGDIPPIVVADPGGHDDAIALVRASVSAGRERKAVPSDLTPDLLKVRDSVADVGACDYEQNVTVLCPRGDPDGGRVLVVIGDSHARAWIPAFDKIAVEGHWTAYYFVKPQCTAAQVTVAPLNDPRPFSDCDAFHDWVTNQVDILQPDLVVVASSPPVNGVFDGDVRSTALDRIKPVLRAGYDALFGDLEAASTRVALLRDVPKSSNDPPSCLTTGDPSLGDCMFEPEERSRELGNVGVSSARMNGAQVVDPTPWLCWQGECPAVIGGLLSYRDTDHITTDYAASLSDSLGRALHMFTDTETSVEADPS